MLEIHSQPIVNLFTGQKVLEEYLSRPDCAIREYFTIRDRNTLIRRELHAILQGIEESTGEIPYNVNVTLYTLPFISKLPFISWRGGIEIVEWEKSITSHSKQTRMTIRDLQAKGLMVWADDITPGDLSMWLRVGVNGFKVELNEIQKSAEFLKNLKGTKKPIIVERIETEEDEQWVKEQGITLAQGYYFGRPERLGNIVPFPTESLKQSGSALTERKPQSGFGNSF